MGAKSLQRPPWPYTRQHSHKQVPGMPCLGVCIPLQIHMDPPLQPADVPRPTAAPGPLSTSPTRRTTLASAGAACALLGLTIAVHAKTHAPATTASVAAAALDVPRSAIQPALGVPRRRPGVWRAPAMKEPPASDARGPYASSSPAALARRLRVPPQHAPGPAGSAAPWVPYFMSMLLGFAAGLLYARQRPAATGAPAPPAPDRTRGGVPNGCVPLSLGGLGPGPTGSGHWALLVTSGARPRARAPALRSAVAVGERPLTVTEGKCKWLGGARGSDGAIYGVPAHARQIIKIDPRTGDLDVLPGAPLGKYKWLRCVPAPDAAIYGIPAWAESVLKIVPGTREVTTFGRVPKGQWKWHGGALGHDGVIYGLLPNAMPRTCMAFRAGGVRWMGVGLGGRAPCCQPPPPHQR